MTTTKDEALAAAAEYVSHRHNWGKAKRAQKREALYQLIKSAQAQPVEASQGMKDIVNKLSDLTVMRCLPEGHDQKISYKEWDRRTHEEIQQYGDAREQAGYERGKNVP